MKKHLLVAIVAAALLLIGFGCVTTKQPAASSKNESSASSQTSTNKATTKSAEHVASVGYTDTPMLPGGKWHVHDPNRPQPRVVAPGTFSTPKTPGKPPSDAIVLFGGTDLSKWRTADGKPSGWKVQDGAMVVPPKNTP